MNFELLQRPVTLLALLFPAYIYAANSGSALLSFEIEDQFKTIHTEESFDEEILIFVTGDREGSNYSRTWGDTINAYFREQIEHPSFKSVPVASLLGMPKLMRGMVRGMMRKAVKNNRDAVMLMDWDNLIHQEYALTDDAANILIFNQDRSLILKKAVYEVTDKSVSEMTSQLDRLFR